MADGIDIVPDSERRGLIGALPPRLRPFASLMRLDRPIGTWLLYWPCAWSVALAGVGGPLGPLPVVLPRRLRDAQRGLRLQRHRRQGPRPARSSAPACARSPAGASSVRSAWVLIAIAVRDRPPRPGSAQPHGGDRRARQHRAGGRLPLHEAHHLVAAGVARPRLLLGRAWSAGPRSPDRSTCRRCCSGSGASPG